MGLGAKERLPRLLAVLAVVSLLGGICLAPMALGQGGEDQGSNAQASDVLFPWVESGSFDDNWLEGLGLVVLGVVGALVTTYLFLGEFLPSMGGKAEYDALKIEIDDLATRRDKQLTAREQFTSGGSSPPDEQIEEANKLTSDLSEIITKKEAAATQLRRSLFLMGFPLYVVLGGAFAVLFATNALQAILIGFGWTAIADRIGLKRELQAKTERRDEAIDTLAKEADASAKKLQETEAALKETKEILKTTNSALGTSVGQSSGGQQVPKNQPGAQPTR
jgi:chaperonin cofactor prefoldin